VIEDDDELDEGLRREFRTFCAAMDLVGIYRTRRPWFTAEDAWNDLPNFPEWERFKTWPMIRQDEARRVFFIAWEMFAQ